MVRDGRAVHPGFTMNDETTPNENDPTTPNPTPPPSAGPGPEDPRLEQPRAEDPRPEDPRPEQPTTQATTEQAGPRRLYRSRGDRVIGGVCAGIAKYFSIDPVIVRIAAVALIFLGGTGIVAYVAALLLMPNEGEDGGPGEAPKRGVVIAGAILLVIAIGIALPFHGGWWDGWSLVPLGLVAIAGLIVWRLASGQRPQGDAAAVVRAMALGVALLVACIALAFGSAWAAAAGGNGVVAGIVIAAGLGLIAGAFVGPQARWLILPALAVAVPAGVVAALNIDVQGGYGEKTYRPANVASISDSYRLGAGKLVVDLRGAHLPPGTHSIKLHLGVGEAQLLVPRNVCVSTRTHLGVGGVQVFDHNSGGVDVDRQEERDAAPGTPHLLVDANVDVGAFEVHHQLDEGWNGEQGNGACA
jgi:phage shock protein PspC (stress-responsive transcriptional regulator)